MLYGELEKETKGRNKQKKKRILFFGDMEKEDTVCHDITGNYLFLYIFLSSYVRCILRFY